MKNESHLEFLKRIDRMRRSIPCTCRNCGAEFTYLHGFSMRECSAECYAATHPKCTYDPETHQMQGVKPTEEEFKDMVTYLVTMHYVFKMLEEGLISLEEYYKISFMMAEKYAPFHGTLLTDVQASEWERKQEKRKD